MVAVSNSTNAISNQIKDDLSFALIKTNDSTDKLYDVEETDFSQADPTGTFTDATGATVNSFGNYSIDPYKPSVSDNQPNVLGMPFIYSPLDDPSQRVYNFTFEDDLPLVFIRPGKPKVNRTLFGSPGTGGLFDLGTGILGRLGNVANEVVGGALPFIGLRSYRDSRFISFGSDYKNYYAFVQSMLSYLHAALGLEGNLDFSTYQNTKDAASQGIPFFFSKGTSISESASNDYGQSDVGTQANAKQAEIRQNKLYASIGQDGSSFLKSVATGIANIVKNVTENIPVIGSLVGAFTENLDGSMLYYPEIWNDSSFSRSYSLEFEFYSPYGDPESIFNNIYVPYISLLALALPQQDSMYSYKQPFIVNVSSPGYFEINCGFVTSMSIQRGEDSLWTSENFPRMLKVNMEIQDMYAGMMITKSARQLKYNVGLSSYIETMAGMRYDQLDSIKRKNMKLKMGQDRMHQIITLRGFRNWVQDKKYNVGMNISKATR